MAQQGFQNLGPAQPIGDWVNKWVVSPVQKVANAVNKIPDSLPGLSKSNGNGTAYGRADLARRVQKANQTFADAAKTRAPKMISKPKASAPKASPRKPMKKGK